MKTICESSRLSEKIYRGNNQGCPRHSGGSHIDLVRSPNNPFARCKNCNKKIKFYLFRKYEGKCKSCFDRLYKPGKWIYIDNKRIKERFNTGGWNEFKFSGCYAIFGGNDKNLLYIGYSTNLRKRLQVHIIKKRDKKGIYFYKTQWGEIKNIKVAIRRDKMRYEGLSTEMRLIQRLKPKYNKEWLEYNNGYFK